MDEFHCQYSIHDVLMDDNNNFICGYAVHSVGETTMASTSKTTSNAQRWTQLVLAVLCMILIANLQYGWTLFVSPINKAHGWALADIQFAFSIFVALETWLTPLQGWIVDSVG